MAIVANTAKTANATHTGDVTGATALTIGADKVLESNLKVVNSSTDEDILTYEATTDEFEWHTPAELGIVTSESDPIFMAEEGNIFKLDENETVAGRTIFNDLTTHTDTLHLGDGSNYTQFSETGDFKLFGTADYLVASDAFAFKAVADEDAGLRFNATNTRFDFVGLSGGTNAWINVSSDGDAYFKGKLGLGTTGAESVLSFLPALLTASSNEGIKFMNAAGTMDAVIQPFNFATEMGVGIGANAFFNTSGAVDRFDNSQESALVLVDSRGEIYFYTGGTGADAVIRMTLLDNGNVGIGTPAPGAKLSIVGLDVYADNATALLGGLVSGDLYRTATGVLKVTY